MCCYFQNVKLLKQFISPYTGQLISYQKTGEFPTLYLMHWQLFRCYSILLLYALFNVDNSLLTSCKPRLKGSSIYDIRKIRVFDPLPPVHTCVRMDRTHHPLVEVHTRAKYTPLS